MTIQIYDLHQAVHAYNFIKQILNLENQPHGISLSNPQNPQNTKKIVPLRWLYYASSIDFFNLISEILDNSNKYTWSDQCVYINIHYKNFDLEFTQTINKLRTLYGGI